MVSRLVAEETVWPELGIRLVRLYSLTCGFGNIRHFSACTKVDGTLGLQVEIGCLEKLVDTLAATVLREDAGPYGTARILPGDHMLAEGFVGAFRLGHLVPMVEATDEASRVLLGRFFLAIILGPIDRA